MDYKLKKCTLDPKIPYGKRLLPTVVDEIAKANPDRVVCKIQKTADIQNGFLHITMAQVAKAVDYMSYWLENQLKKHNGKQSTISYMGSADIRYWIMILAAIKIGSPIVLPSLKNSVPNNESLYNATKCRTLFYSSTNVHRATDLAFVMNNELHISEIPTWDDMITQNSEHYPYTDTWETAAKKPILVLHTSGSTGNPKPITYNHAFVNTFDTARSIPSVDGQEPFSPAILEQGPASEFYLGFPFFHLGGLAFFFQPIWYDTVMVLGPAEVPANGKALMDLMKHNKLTTLTSPPSLLEDIAKEYRDEFERYCGNTKILIYGGGPLAPFAGDYFSKHIPVMAQVMGSTESGFLPLVSKSPEEWQWLYFHPMIGGLHFEQDEDQPDLYELIIKRTPGQEWIQGVFQTFPELDVWRTKDHYRRHPTKEHYWCFVGRVDDMLVLSNGEKFNPVGMETSIAQHPAVRSVIVVGQARFQCAMIIELKDGVQYDAAIISDIWPVIENANMNSPAHAQIDKDLVILADPKKPFQRASKGTVQRWKVNKDYDAEVDTLYENFASRAPGNSIEYELSSATDESAVQKFLEDIVSQILPGKQIKDTDDFFVLGLDSLQTSQLSSSINSTLKGHIEASKNISTRFIYENPSIRQLKAAILALTTGTSAGISDGIEDQMRAIVEKCTSHLPAKVATKPNANGKFNVALTGSTGSLGFYIIVALLANPKCDKIYCLDRSPTAQKKFAERWAVLGEAHLTPAPGRMHFYQTEFGHPTFGLPDAEYSELSNNVNAIIHNAWKVNFNHPLSSFSSQIDGVEAFTHLSLTSPLQPTLYFVSSISSAGSYPGIIPEQILTDYSVPSSMGYGRSKYVSERVMDVAARKAGANMTVFRVGQIGGPVLNGVKGQWNLQEWFPSLVKTSGELGILPDTLGAMDNIEWIPVDVLGRVMVELIQIPPNNPETEGARVYNFVNPHLASWKNLIPSIQAYYAAKGKEIKVVTFKEWLGKISELGEDELTLEKFPSKKIQDFFESISQENGMGGGFETDRLVKDSETMKTLPPVGKEWIELWLSQWTY